MTDQSKIKKISFQTQFWTKFFNFPANFPLKKFKNRIFRLPSIVKWHIPPSKIPVCLQLIVYSIQKLRNFFYEKSNKVSQIICEREPNHLFLCFWWYKKTNKTFLGNNIICISKTWLRKSKNEAKEKKSCVYFKRVYIAASYMFISYILCMFCLYATPISYSKIQEFFFFLICY